MKKFLLGTLIVIGGLFTLATGAGAELGGVQVHIDQDFVAGGKALHAGTYKVYPSSPEPGQTLVLRDEETGSSIFIRPTVHDFASTGQLKVELTRVGDIYYLSEVVTDLGTYSFSAPRILTRMTKAKHDATMISLGSN
jgi:hypothetical protein